jgi:two-component system phosphate regulon response regulator PhoB
MQKKKPLVLIVDDQPDNLYMYSHYLENTGRLDVITAMTGREALVKAQRLKPDVILLDLTMPAMNGYDVARELAAGDDTRAIPLVLVSAYASQHEAEKVLGDGFASFVGEVAQGYVSKPCAPDVLLQHVRQAVNVEAPA